MRSCLFMGNVKSPSLRTKVRARPPDVQTLFGERSDMGNKTKGQIQVSTKTVLSELGWHLQPPFSPLLPSPRLLSAVLTKLVFYCELLRLTNSKGFLLPAESTAPKGPLQPDAFSGKGGGRGGRRQAEGGVKSLSLLRY